MISAILTAAGTSSRMGQINKLLLPWNGTPLAAHAAKIILAANVDELIVVLGHEATAIAQTLQTHCAGLPWKTTLNPNYSHGLTGSIQQGIKAADPRARGYLICHGDQPLLTPEIINTLINAFSQQAHGSITAPLYHGFRGNPVLFSASWRSEILAHTAPNGCRAILEANPEALCTVDIDAPHASRDIDTPEDYQKACQSKEA